MLNLTQLLHVIRKLSLFVKSTQWTGRHGWVPFDVSSSDHLTLRI